MLGRFEQQVIEAILVLEPDRAYGSAIQAHLEEVTGEGVALGAVYTTLYRLQEKGFLESRKSDPEPVRGGRSKRLFRVLGLGERALGVAREMRSDLVFARFPKPETR